VTKAAVKVALGPSFCALDGASIRPDQLSFPLGATKSLAGSAAQVTDAERMHEIVPRKKPLDILKWTGKRISKFKEDAFNLLSGRSASRLDLSLPKDVFHFIIVIHWNRRQLAGLSIVGIIWIFGLFGVEHP
jgi:hypothetical protein